MSSETAPLPAVDIVYDVQNLTLTFGGVVSLDNLSLQMFRKEILAIIGPNGAGKTSLFNSLTGVYTPQRGCISLSGRPGQPSVNVMGGKPHMINRLGAARTFQNIRLFPALTALENVRIGVETRQRSGPVSAMLALPRQHKDDLESTETAIDLLDRVGLQHRADALAGSLSYGEQRRLEIARALATNPGVLLLDEPAAGTNPAEKSKLAALITRINTDYDISVLLIEHDMKLVMSVAHRVVVLNFGRKIAEGTPSEIQRNPAVIAAYLGTTTQDEPATRASSAEPSGTSQTPANPEQTRSTPTPSTPQSGDPTQPDGHATRIQRVPLLDVRRIDVRYGVIQALRQVSFHVNEGEIVALLGANGAGKTTTQKTVSGMLRPAAGTIQLDGQRIEGIPAHQLIRLGICHVPEGRHVFPRMTVRENLNIGAYRFEHTQPAELANVLELFPPLKERINQPAGTLSGGEQQMLAIGRALMGKPRVLLLDEPSMGLAPLIVNHIFGILRDVNAAGVTVLLVEQNAEQALTLADRGYVLETGEIVAEGTGRELLNDDRIRAAYLGEPISAPPVGPPEGKGAQTRRHRNPLEQ